MQRNQYEQGIGKRFMQFTDPFHSPVAVGCISPAAQADESDDDEQQHYHPPAQRIVAEVARFARRRHVAGIIENRRR